MLENILKHMGLAQKEILLYKIILQNREILPSRLSRISKINRTTVYSIVKKLIDFGLVYENRNGKKMFYSISVGTELDKIILRSKNIQENLKTNVGNLKSFLENMTKEEKMIEPKVRYVFGKNISDHLTSALPRWYKTMNPENFVQWGFQDYRIIEKYLKETDFSWSVAPKYMELRLFTNENFTEELLEKRNYNKKRKIKFLKTHHFTCTQFVIGDYVIYIKSDKNEDFLFEVEDKIIAENMRVLFTMLWEKY